jgi:hypothetical protein
MRYRCLALALSLGGALAPKVALGDPAGGVSTPAEAPRHYGSFRLGFSSADQSQHPQLCLDLSPLPWLSVSGCGTGNGFLFRDDSPDLAHFQGKLRLASLETKAGWLEPHLAIGFAELQIGEDEAGFSFGGADGLRSATAGPEVGASLRALFPTGSRFELVGELSLGLAWLPPLQPSLSASFGVGF